MPSEESLFVELRAWRGLHHPADFLLVDVRTQQGSKGLFGRIHRSVYFHSMHIKL